MMNEDIGKTEALVGRAFEYDSADIAPSEDRVQRIMRRIRTAVATREIMVLIFVRLWLAVLEFGATVYAASSARRRRGAGHHQTNEAS